MIVEGDVMGDDLGLYPRFKQIMSVADTPVYFVGGNHDLDFDAPSDQHSFDTFRREFGPPNYSFDIGDVHFVVLDNVVYPCTTETDNADGKHGFCDASDTEPTYNGRVTDEQIEWLNNDLALVPEDKLVVLNMHIPLVTFMDLESTKHQTSNAAEVYAAVEGRPALALSGHTHTIEQIREGENYAGWQQAVGVGPSPFPQIVTGAPSGSWWSGDLDAAGIPMGYQRLGAPRGYLLFEFDGNQFQDTYKASGKPVDAQMSVSIDSPRFREWYNTMYEWVASYIDEEGEENFEERSKHTPPLNINDLGDTQLLTPTDLNEGTFLAVNVWNGSKDTAVSVAINGGEPIQATRTQEGEGEEARQGVEYADPFAVVRQMQVARYAFASQSGEPRNQGFELWKEAAFQGDPQPLQEWMIADQSNHLWKAQLPADLETGIYNAAVTVTDHFGRKHTSNLTFEVMEEIPPMRFRSELFE
ncbi:MAG: calcineurin-like phosphoesterase C-terminal domain-containing protein [Geminicoccaceae bacterium]